MRAHKRTRKALYTPDTQCPVPEEQLDNYRRTIAYKPDGTLEDFEDKYKDLPQQQKNKRRPGPAWSGETWFKVKETTRPPAPPLPKAPAAVPAPTLATPKASAAKATTHQQQQQAPQPTGSAVRHREKKPVEQPLAQQQQPMKQQTYPGTAVPGPKDTPATADYWIKERTVLEESPCTTTDSALHPTTNNGRPRRHKAIATTTNNSQANIRSQRIQD